MAARIWTLEQRQLQREAIHKWKPWEQSTGPKSPEGKAVVGQNSWKGGHRAKLRAVVRMVRQELSQARELLDICR